MFFQCRYNLFFQQNGKLLASLNMFCLHKLRSIVYLIDFFLQDSAFCGFRYMFKINPALRSYHILISDPCSYSLIVAAQSFL